MDPKVILFDKRILSRNLEKETITQKDLEKHLSSLADLEAECEVIDLDSRDEEEEEHSNDDAHARQAENGTDGNTAAH